VSLITDRYTRTYSNRMTFATVKVSTIFSWGNKSESN